jgi:hypothetical protein
MFCAMAPTLNVKPIATAIAVAVNFLIKYFLLKSIGWMKSVR